MIDELNQIRLMKKRLENELEDETLKLQKLALDKTKLSRDLQNKKMESQANLIAAQMGVPMQKMSQGDIGDL